MPTRLLSIRFPVIDFHPARTGAITVTWALWAVGAGQSRADGAEAAGFNPADHRPATFLGPPPPVFVNYGAGWPLPGLRGRVELPGCQTSRSTTELAWAVVVAMCSRTDLPGPFASDRVPPRSARHTASARSPASINRRSGGYCSPPPGPVHDQGCTVSAFADRGETGTAA